MSKMKFMDFQLNPERLRAEVIFQAVRSRGPGGQNVNKVSSAALLTWDFMYSRLLNDEQKARVAFRLQSIINGESQIFIRSDEFRDLERNKARCLEKLAERVSAALFVPKKRKRTKPTRASRERKLEQKKRRSQTKKWRGKVDY
jgi:ribosome-associated protein